MSRQEFRLPDLGEGTVASEVVTWHAQRGDRVTEGQPLVEMSTDKAVVEIPAPVSGVLVDIHGAPGDSIAVGAVLAVFETADTPVAAPVSAPATRRAPVAASPSTRRRAQEAGIDLASVTGTGPGGRILREDLDAVLTAPAVEAPVTAAPPPVAAAGGIEEVRVIGVRRVIAQRMLEATRTIPHFSYVEETDVTELEALRQHLNAREATGQAAFSLLPFIAMAVVRALRDFPQCNAHYDSEREVLRRFASVHLGIATQTPDGLKVPVVRDAQRLGVRPLAAEIRRVTGAARERTASRDLLSGSTVTITSLGKLGGVASTPIINPPELAIIGVNRASDRPAVRQGAIVIRHLMNLSASFDHRFIDGAEAAAFVQAIREFLEHPAMLFITTEGGT